MSMKPVLLSLEPSDWDDTECIAAWDAALAEYKKYHSIRARGITVEKAIREFKAKEVRQQKQQHERASEQGRQEVTHEQTVRSIHSPEAGSSLRANAMAYQGLSGRNAKEEHNNVHTNNTATDGNPDSDGTFGDRMKVDSKDQDEAGGGRAGRLDENTAILAHSRPGNSLNSATHEPGSSASVAQPKERTQAVPPASASPTLPTGTTSASIGTEALPGASPHFAFNMVTDEATKNLMMSWYYAGYYTGLFEGQQRAAQMTASSGTGEATLRTSSTTN